MRFHISGVKHFHHREVGDLELNYERLEVVFDTGLTIFTYTADRHAIRRSARPARQLGRHHRRRKADRDAACA